MTSKQVCLQFLALSSFHDELGPRSANQISPPSPGLFSVECFITVTEFKVEESVTMKFFLSRCKTLVSKAILHFISAICEKRIVPDMCTLLEGVSKKCLCS